MFVTNLTFSRIDTEEAHTEAPPAPPAEFQASSQDPWLTKTSPAPILVDDRLFRPVAKQQQDWTWTRESSAELSSPQPQVVRSNLQTYPTPSGFPPGTSLPGAQGYPSFSPVAAVPSYPQVGLAPSYPPLSSITSGNPLGSHGPQDKTDQTNDTAEKSSFNWKQLKEKIKRPFEAIKSKIQTTFQSLSQREDGGSSLPSINSMRRQIKSALGLPQSLSSLSFSTKSDEQNSDEDTGGIFDNLESLTKQKLQRVNQSLRNFITNSNKILKAKTETEQTPQYQTSYQSSAYQTSYSSSETVTASPIPVPVPTYLPVRKSGEFSAGFQVLMQYVVAMIGVAVVLAI